MGNLIKRFSDGTSLEYDRGSFDAWCVYMVDANGNRKPPLDKDYFRDLKVLAIKYGVNYLYDAYVYVYDNTEKQVTEEGLNAAEKASLRFSEDQLEVQKIFTILYMAMIAEENKRYTRLGKRIKRLGIYKLLFENVQVNEAADFMRGMGWRDIDALCKERGF